MEWLFGKKEEKKPKDIADTIQIKLLDKKEEMKTYYGN